MGHNSGISSSRGFNTQLFAVVGPSYVPEQLSEFRTAPRPRKARAGSRRRWLAFWAAAGLILLAANSANIVDATARNAALVSASQPSGFAPSMAIFGGGEPIRW
jgi:drug/metabolite transporter (DMT)-like permease